MRVGILAAAVLAAAAAQPWQLLAQAPEPTKGVKFAQISPTDMKEWLSYLASDELQGRQIYTEGFGLAAGYISERLKDWGVKPLNPDGTYLQPVPDKGYKVTRNSTVIVNGPDGVKTFKHGDHVTFSAGSGGKQTVNYAGAEFVGYGAAADLQGRDLKGKLVLIVRNPNPQGGRGRGGALGGAAGAIAAGAKGVVTFAPTPAPLSAADQALLKAQAALIQASDAIAAAQRGAAAGAGGRGAGGGRGNFGGGLTQQQVDFLLSTGLTQAQVTNLQNASRGNFGGAAGRGALPAADLTSLQRVDAIVTPQFTGDETFFDALFGAGPVKFADVRTKLDKGEPLQAMSLPVKASVTIDNTFEVVSEQVSHNVVGMIEGADPKLKDTYVLFGAHLDHIGYSQTGQTNQPSPSRCRNRSEASQAALKAAGKVYQRGLPPAAGAGRGAAGPQKPFDERDVISNGADDDGSGSTSLLAVAKAFATGPKPKRSVVFVWHTGEEEGLNGSQYNADFPVVPLEKVQAQLNMDMVGRDDCDNIEGDYTNTLFLVGDDRISTDLHNLIIQTNTTQMTKPLTLDYELNDVNDPESVYTRSDHYSYAAKGIPIAFFTTGLHPDYHRVSDTVDKIIFPKMARVAQLVYETGFNIANTEKVLERDNKGPQSGFGSKAEIIKKK